MKKLISFVLAASMLGAVPVMASAEKNIAETIEFLNAVGIETGYDAETIDAAEKITRATFADNVIRLIGMDGNKCNTVYYHDVSRDHWAFDSVGMMTEMGYLIGDGENNFYPEQVITKQEAVRILIGVLGYDAQANALGGYYTGYMNLAGELELLDGCSSQNELTYPDMYIMFENVLKANLTELTVIDGKLGFKESEEQTLLSKYYDVYYDKGILNGCENVSLLKDGEIIDDTALIDGIEYETKLDELLPYIGMEVEFMYRADSADSDDRELVWVKDTGKNEYADIVADPDSEYDTSDNTFSYIENEKDKTLKLSAGMMVIYNGSLYAGAASDILSLDRFHVRFIKEKSSSKYNIAVVERYENMVVGTIDTNEEKIYDKFSGQKALSLAEEDYDSIVFTDGKAADDIKTGDVVSYYISGNGKKLKATITRLVERKTIKGISGTTKTVITTEDGDYELYDKSVGMSGSLGDTVDMYIDCDGFVAYVKRASSKNTPIYIIKAYVDEETERLSLKFLGTDGEVVKKNCVEKIKIDGYVTKNPDEAVAKFQDSDNATIQQLAVIALNSNDEITKIDTCEKTDKEETSNSLRKTETFDNIWYKFFGQFGPKGLVNNGTIIFSVPSTPSSDDALYTIRGMSDLKNDQRYTADAYRYNDENNVFEDLLVIKDKTWGFAGGAKSWIMVDRIDRGLNADDAVVENLIGYSQGAQVTYQTDGTFSFANSGISEGDIIAVEVNGKNEIKNAQIKYDCDSGKRPWENSDNFNDTGLMAVYANDVDGNVLKGGYASGADFDRIFLVQYTTPMVYDSNEKQKVRKGTMNDIKTYENAGNACSTVVVVTIGGEVYGVYIYR